MGSRCCAAVDAAAVFTITSYANLLRLKRGPDQDFRWMLYRDAGLDLCPKGVMFSEALGRDKLEVMRGLVRAIDRATREVAADPGLGPPSRRRGSAMPCALL